MNIKLKVWWKELDAKEQSGIIVFGSIIAGIPVNMKPMLQKSLINFILS